MKKYIFLLVLGLICSVSTVYASLYSIKNHDITAAAEQKLNENANFPQYARVKLLSDDDMHFDIKIVTPPSGSGSGHWVPDYDRKSCSSMGYTLTVNDCNSCTHVLEGRCPKNPNYYKHCNVNKKIFVSKCTGEGYSGGVTEGIVTTCKDSGGTSIFSVRDESYQEYYEVCKCAPGYYWTANGCVKCPCGTYKSSVSNLGEGVTSCQTCPEGKFCPEASDTPSNCPYGSEGVGAGLCSADQCTRCGSCEYSNAQTEGKCVTCEPGSYPNTDNTECVECIKGHSCEGGCLRKCDKGYYQDGIGSSSCKSCSAGQCCPITGMEEPGTCKAGYYCQYVTDDCNDIPCPEGNRCPAGSQNPIPCEPGTYSPNSGNAYCSTCKAGNYCASSGMAAQTRCPEGYCCTKDGLKGLPGGMNCSADGSDCAIKCPAGYFCAFECENEDCTKKRGCTTPQACPAGTYSQEGAKACIKCPEGKYCPNSATSVPLDCPEGKYCPAGSSEPKGCPNGYYCPTNSKEPIVCPIGSYCPANSTTHTPCPEGSYTDSVQQTKCQKCGPGSATNVAGTGASNCSLCPKGTYSTQEANVSCTKCGAGSATGLNRDGANDCQECEPGYYSTQEANALCTPCGRGKATGTDAKAATTCNVCSAGTYSDAEANTFCKDCGKGSSTGGVNSGAQTCLPCEAGTYSTGTQNVTCTNCGPGKSTKSPYSGAENCTSCARGTYSSAEKNTECQRCPEGQVANTDSTGCTACEDGTYPKSDQSECLACGINSYCSAGIKIACPTGNLCYLGGNNISSDPENPGKDPDSRCTQSSECKCDLRQFIYPDPTNMMAANVCPGTLAGNICVDSDGRYGTDCVCGGSNCAYGCAEYYTYPEKCASSCKTCCDLSYRFKCEATGNVSGGSGTSCGGYYTACACNAGYEWNSLTGQCEKTCTYEVTTAPDSCVSQYTSCVDSSVSPSVERYKLISCAAGCYANDSLNPTSCTLCEPGTYKNTDGNATSCAICEKGWICEGGNSHYQCEEKTCADQERSTVCKPCGEGVLACSATTCKASACETGYNLVDGVCVANACTGYTLTTAPSGSLANYSSCIKSDKLTYYKIDSCKAGHKATVDSGVITSCTPCETGTYQPTETANTSCIDASVGCFVSTTGATQQTACNAGYYAATTKATNCSQPCGEGKYCSQKSTAPHCTETQECPENSTTLFDTSGSVGNCVCKAGYTLESGSCRPCPAGTYKNSVGNDVCLPCPTGSYSNTTGATSCSACPTGTGIYSCNPTDKTLICAGGYVLNNGVCTQCLEGNYCPQGSTSQLPCQEGYTSNRGSDDEGDCFSATCGSEYIFTSENCTSLCGSVCTSDGTDYYSCCATCPSDVTSCPAGQYLYTTTRPVNNTDFCKECRPCEDGKYCTGGTAQMQDCPANATCSGTGNSNFTCNAGYYSDGTQCIATSVGCYSTAGATSQTSCTAGSYSTDASGRNEASDCEACGLNTYCPKSGSCTVQNACPNGRITASTGTTAIGGCICPANSYGANCTSGSCTECDDCPENSTSVKGATSINDCKSRAGYCVDTNSRSTEVCPQGNFCEGANNCASLPSCSTGKTTEGVGATSEDGCCPNAGYYGTCGSGPATACPIGTYKTYIGSTTGTEADCESCPPGYTTQYAGSTSAEQCIESACDASIFKYNSSNCTDGADLGGEECQSGASKSYSSCTCPNGYSLTGWNPGTYGTTKGNIAGQTCMSTNTNACTCGSECSGGSSSPEQCPAGKYTPTTGASSCSTCPENSTSSAGTCGSCTCNNGYYYNSENNTCIKCDENYYCEPGATSQQKCPVGKESPAGSDNVSACTVKCGYYGNSGAGDATQCEAGYYCEAGASVQSKCDDGKTSPAGSCSETACVDATCPEEFKYTEANCSNLSGSTCQAGSTVLYSACTCPEGYSTEITYCPAGNYLVSEGVVGELPCNRCSECPVNTYQAQSNFTGTSCTKCPDGTTSTVEATALTGCKAGAGYCLNTSTEEVDLCQQDYYCQAGSVCPGKSCPTNKTSNQGATNVDGCYAKAGYYGADGEGDALACEVDHYCPLRSTTGQPCPTNKTTSGTGADDVSDCLANPGYSGTPDNTPATACVKGTYKDTKENSYCKTCPDNMTTEQTASTSDTQCVAVAGYYGPAGGPVEVCGKGNYCLGGSSGPQSCPTGKTTTSDVSTSVNSCCPKEGYFGTCGGEDATICPAGTYKDVVGAAESCTACTGNMTSNEGSTSQSDCYEAKCTDSAYLYYYISVDDNNCSQGALGGDYKQIAGTSVICYAECKCSNLKNAEYGQTTCQAGQKVAETSSTEWEGNGEGKHYCVKCSTCDSGTYQDQTSHTDTECKTCLANSAPNEDRKTCEPVCGYYKDGNSFKPCGAGNYCAGGSSSQVACPKGHYCPEGTGELDSGCENQPIQCPCGYYCQGGSSEPTKCPAGTFSLAGAQSADQCIDCTKDDRAENKYCPQAESYPLAEYCSPQGCPDGKVPTEDKKGCGDPDDGVCVVSGLAPEKCPAGSQATNGYTECGACSEGFYATSGKTCDECGKGYYCPKVDSAQTICGKEIVPTTRIQCQTNLTGSVTTASATATSQEECINAAGYYYSNEYKECEAGYYCPEGQNRQACEVGTYNPSTKQTDASACKQCPEGYYCPAGTGTLDDGKKCPQGYYCPAGTKDLEKVKCPDNSTTAGLTGQSDICSCQCNEGYYMNYTNGHVCTLCQAGYYCPAHTVEYTGSCPDSEGATPQFCTQGQCSAAGSSSCSNCPVGTHSLGTASAGYLSEDSTSACSPCDPGTYSSKEGSWACSECEEGYYCPSATESQTICGVEVTGTIKEPCPAGTYSNAGASSCTPCEAGTYSTGNAAECTPCQEGSYCPANEITGLYDSKVTCPEGHKCPAGSTSATACEVGTFSNEGASSCTPCNAGQYQDEAGKSSCKPCSAGTYTPADGVAHTSCTDCDAGDISGEGAIKCTKCDAGTYENGDRTACVTCECGYYCTGGTHKAECGLGKWSQAGATTGCTYCGGINYCPFQTTCQEDVANCPANTHSAQGSSSIDDCKTDAGYYWLTASSEEPMICPAGYYCKANGSRTNPGDNKVACPAGTYNPDTGKSSEEACQPCPVGHYCPITGISAAPKCPAGTYNPDTGKSSLDDCLNCPIDNYCIAGSAEPAACPAHTATWNMRISSSNTMTNPLGGANPLLVSNPAPSATSTNPVNPPDTGSSPSYTLNKSMLIRYLKRTGATKITQCIPSLGYYWKNDETLARCGAGAILYSDNTCEGKDSLAIAAGEAYGVTYASEAVKQRGNAFYPAVGIMINDEFAVALATSSEELPLMYQYNPTKYSYFINPWYGTQRNGVVNTASMDAAIYCARLNLNWTSNSWYQGTVDAMTYRWFIPTTAQARLITNPPTVLTSTYNAIYNKYWSEKDNYGYSIAALDNNSDPHSIFANQVWSLNISGTSFAPQTVANGTITGTIRGQSVASNYASAMCVMSIYKRCLPWYGYINVGTTTANVLLDDTTPGGTCIGNTNTAITKQVNPDTGAWTTYSSVDMCLEGTCLASAGGSCVTCPEGYICPVAGSDLCSEMEQCAAGTYSAAGATSCTTCPAGYYCEGGSSKVSCGATQYSPAGSDSANDCVTCPAGKYCTSTGVYSCPNGTYNPNTGATSSDACLSCDPGQYTSLIGSGAKEDCLTCTGGTKPNVIKAGCTNCTAGYSCTRGIETICPAGTYSLAGASECTPCPAGSYSATDGSSSCTSCDPGQYSAGNATSCSTCPAGYRCPGGTDKIVCPSGSYSAASSTSCTICPAGYQCPGGTNKIACPAGQYQGSTGQSSCVSCTSGFYCPGTLNDNTYQGADELECPAGRYSCVDGASVCTMCSAGSYQDSTGATGCLSCSAGTYFAGMGATSVQACKNCPAGYECPQTYTLVTACWGARFTYTIKKACEAGTYSTGSASSCTTCPAGHYCPLNKATGLYDKKVACPAGTYNENTEATSADACLPCPSGTYSNIGASECTPCSAGTYNENTEATSADACLPCPSGTYSNIGASKCTTCSDGSYSLGTGNTYCSTCPPGYFCKDGNKTGCSAGTYSSGGASKCTSCLAGSFTYGTSTSSSATSCISCTAGYYCPGGTNRVPCPANKYRATQGAKLESDCLACPTYNTTYKSTTLGKTGMTKCKAPLGFFINSSGALAKCHCGTGQYVYYDNISGYTPSGKSELYCGLYDDAKKDKIIGIIVTSDGYSIEDTMMVGLKNGNKVWSDSTLDSYPPEVASGSLDYSEHGYYNTYTHGSEWASQKTAKFCKDYATNYALGHGKWFVPAAAQLVLIDAGYKSSIATSRTKAGGDDFQSKYWTSDTEDKGTLLRKASGWTVNFSTGKYESLKRNETAYVLCFSALIPQHDTSSNLSFFDINSGAEREITLIPGYTTAKCVYTDTYSKTLKEEYDERFKQTGLGRHVCSCETDNGTFYDLTAPTTQSGTRSCSTTGTWSN